jgi:hypothetical protein
MSTKNTGSRDAQQTQQKQQKHPEPSLPVERDTKPEANAPRTHKKMLQASDDLSRGQVDTDQHGERGIDQAVNPENIIDTPRSSHDVKKN